MPVAVPAGQSHYTENQTITKYEIMDGAPVKGAQALAHVHTCVFVLIHVCVPTRAFVDSYVLVAQQERASPSGCSSLDLT